MYNRKKRGPNTEPCGTEGTNFSFRNTWADLCCLASIFKIRATTAISYASYAVVFQFVQ